VEFISRLIKLLKGTDGYYDIDSKTMIQLRIQTFVDGKFRQAINNVYIPSERKQDAIKILLDTAQKLKQLRKK
jgi:hypothetical protein